MFTMKKKIISGSLVTLMALGLAGCASNTAAPASKVSSHPQTTKVSQPSTKKATNSSIQVTTEQPSAKTQASYAAQANTNSQDEKVVNQFGKASGVKENNGTQYMVSQANSKGNYQVEVRNSQGDPNVSHLAGLYHFNPATNEVQQMDPVTGQFENK